MSDVEITVRGAYTAFAPPERATVKLRVGLEGPDSSKVYAAASEAAAAIRASIEPLHAPASGPVTWWSSGQVRTWAHRPWNKDGKQLPLVHSARVEFDVKFSDFPAMSSWIREAATHRGTAVMGIEWSLTEDHRKRLAFEVRAAAVADATEKAEAYAAALGLTAVRALALADAGMLGEGRQPAPAAPGVAYSRASQAADGVGDIELAPKDIAVTAEVDARFVAS